MHSRFTWHYSQCSSICLRLSSLPHLACCSLSHSHSHCCIPTASVSPHTCSTFIVVVCVCESHPVCFSPRHESVSEWILLVSSLSCCPHSHEPPSNTVTALSYGLTSQLIQRNPICKFTVLYRHGHTKKRCLISLSLSLPHVHTPHALTHTNMHRDIQQTASCSLSRSKARPSSFWHFSAAISPLWCFVFWCHQCCWFWEWRGSVSFS